MPKYAPVAKSRSRYVHWSTFGYRSACGSHQINSAHLTRTPSLVTCPHAGCRKAARKG